MGWQYTPILWVPQYQYGEWGKAKGEWLNAKGKMPEKGGTNSRVASAAAE